MGTGNKKTFGQSLMSYVADKLPYSSSYKVVDNISDVNPKFRDFYEVGTRRDDLISKHSISTLKNEDDGSPMASMAIDKNYHAFMYANVDYDKSKRLRDYRVMGQFAEVADALDEICDECINADENGDIVHMRYESPTDDVNIITDLSKEFNVFVGHYQLETKGWDYFRQLLVDGEVYFEHIIHKKHTNAGILGIIQIPSELMDPIYDNIQNLLIKGFLLRKPVPDDSKSNTPSSNPSDKTKIEHIPFDAAQVTYVNSGLWNETKTLRLPFIENARRAYRQLSLIEDAIIIYRLVRAPERLVFNVDVGNMSAPKAEAYLRKLMQNYWAKKSYDSNQGKSVQTFNPQSMLDNFWFAKRTGGEGTNVTSLAGGQNLGQLDDLLYFKQKLYRALKVPVERLNPEAQTDAQGATILREELKFARFIIRLQDHFSAGIKHAFITHLKLKGLWESYDMKEHYINISFNPPTNFHELRTQQIYDLKWTNYNNAIQNPLVSDTYAKKHMLKMNDEEIQYNRELLRKDSAFQWEIAQITALGPNWRDAMDAQAEGGVEGGELGGLGGLGGGGMGGGGLPPDFGPAPPVEGGEGPAGDVEPTPVGGDSALPV